MLLYIYIHFQVEKHFTYNNARNIWSHALRNRIHTLLLMVLIYTVLFSLKCFTQEYKIEKGGGGGGGYSATETHTGTAYVSYSFHWQQILIYFFQAMTSVWSNLVWPSSCVIQVWKEMKVCKRMNLHFWAIYRFKSAKLGMCHVFYLDKSSRQVMETNLT